MKLYNSADGKYKTIDVNKVSIYNCGPTVYNHVHIGNVRPLITFDVLFRYLEFIGTKTCYIHNLTDIDDKIISVAKKLNISEKELTEKYINSYLDLFKIINIKKMVMPKVSDNIKEIIQYIEKLVEKKAAYVSDGDVYFDIKNAKDYGSISHKNIDELLDGVRKDNLSNKKYPLDFALWKKTEDGLNWKAIWSKGRPGWHTECCVLINKYVGDHVDIHGGGIDLKFPHHENENAQNKALFNKDIANIWMHVGHVNIDNQKMAKSSNNFILVKEFVTTDNANGLRWFFYQTKYENPINFSIDLFNDANDDVKSLIKNINSIKTNLLLADAQKINTHSVTSDFKNAIEEDLNFPNVVMTIKNEIKKINVAMKQKDFILASKLLFSVEQELSILGIVINKIHTSENIDLIKEWKKMSTSKKFTEADIIRKELIQRGLM